MKTGIFPALLLCCVAARAQQMPQLHGRSLADTTVNLPADLNGRVGIVVVGFSKASSSQTRVWGEALAHDFGSDAHVAYYEIPVLAEVPGFIRGFIVDGIRKQLPPSERNHFVPVVKDSAPWKSLTSFTASDDAYIVVTDAAGQVQWRTHGALQAEVYGAMKKRIETLKSSPSARALPPA